MSETTGDESRRPSVEGVNLRGDDDARTAVQLQELMRKLTELETKLDTLQGEVPIREMSPASSVETEVSNFRKNMRVRS